MSELGFDIPPIHRSYGNDDIGLKCHLKYKRSGN